MGSNEARETVLGKERMDVTCKSGRKVTERVLQDPSEDTMCY